MNVRYDSVLRGPPSLLASASGTRWRTPLETQCSEAYYQLFPLRKLSQPPCRKEEESDLFMQTTFILPFLGSTCANDPAEVLSGTPTATL